MASFQVSTIRKSIKGHCHGDFSVLKVETAQMFDKVPFRIVNQGTGYETLP